MEATTSVTNPAPAHTTPRDAALEEDPRRSWRLGLGFIGTSVALMTVGTYYGLALAPAEKFMGEVSRIMYVHVPTAWVSMVCLTLAFIAAVGFLASRSWKWDALLEASVELGVVYAFLLCVQGAIWAKPTWGVWWDWDPRLTTTAVMLFAFLGILALRRFVDDPDRRASWSAVATIVSWVDVPIVYYSVRWWNSLHQTQNTTKSVNPLMAIPLYLNALGVLALTIGLVILLRRIALMRLARIVAPPEQS